MTANELYILKAKGLYENDDTRIDEDADVNMAHDGAWVEAWVWVPDE